MKLNPTQIKKLNIIEKVLNKQELLEHFSDQKNKTTKFLQSLIHNELNGWEMVLHQPHPMIFELGHITLFYLHHFLRHFVDLKISNEYYEMFDSLQNKPLERVQSDIISFQKQYELYNDTMDIVEQFIEKHELNTSMKYMLNVCILHNEMHNEVFLFLLDMLQHKTPIERNIKLHISNINDNNKLNNGNIKNTFILIHGGNYQQGLHINDKENVWDNERPKHEVIVNDFYCQKYPVTNGEYIEFIEDGGYENLNYWSNEGKKWLKKYKRNMPYFWKKIDGNYYRSHFNRQIPIINEELIKPVVKVNYYEAEAYASYKGCRLPTESEYEYMSTNKGTTLYPWGNSKNVEQYANVNYSHGDVLPVIMHEDYANDDGIVDLMGNCWYWTSTHFHPYDGFEIDPIYDTFSYPFFYFRMVVKGAAWTCGKQLVYPQYRNSQEPEKSFHYTGIRLVKDKID
jgi:ergothioneine biosynthesis protein EgtB